jgi:macrolide transport system ATP-binding/permease protein
MTLFASLLLQRQAVPMNALIHAQHLYKAYGLTTVLNDVTVILNPGERIGLVGANGAGKSTLLKIIAGEIPPDDGSVRLDSSVTVGYLPQVITGYDDRTVSDLLADADRDLRQMESRLRVLEAIMSQSGGDALTTALTEYGDLTEQFERRGGYDLDQRIATVVRGLRVDHLPQDRLFGTLSGGERARLGLALLLLSGPDTLLLDEPTNHLDSASLNWLERYLAAFPGGMLVVSHDREFLNRTVSAIVEIDEHSRSLKRYNGDYDTYAAAKLREREQQQREYEAQQEELAVLRLAVAETARSNRNYRPQTDGDKLLRNAKIAKHDTTVSKRVKSAEERLKRLEANKLPPPPIPLRFDPALNPEVLRARLPIMATGIHKCYGDRVILGGVNLTVYPESRIALVGPNGAGKSTLLKILVGMDSADSGEVQRNPALKIGYLDQAQGLLDPALTLVEAALAGLPDWEPHQMHTFLIRSGLFHYADFETRVGDLSSGQRRKLQIARMLTGRANLLALDEPTNDVSFDVLEGLESAIQAFPGPVIVATHDRRFLQHFGGQVYRVEGGRLIEG